MKILSIFLIIGFITFLILLITFIFCACIVSKRADERIELLEKE